MENQAKSLTPRQSNFPAVHLFSAFCFFLFVVCALFCIACRSPALSLSFIGRRRVDPRKACHLGEISGKNSPGCLAQNFHLPSRLCPSGLRGWTQVPLVQTAWGQIPQVSYGSTPALPPPQKTKCGCCRHALAHRNS